MRLIGLFALICLLSVTLLAQDQSQKAQKKMTVEQVRAVLEQVLQEDGRITVRLKSPVPARRDGWGRKQLSKISGKVVEVQDDYFIVEDNSLLLGDVKATVFLSDVVAVKKQPKFIRGLQRTGEVAALGSIGAAVAPPLLGAYLLHFASGGKIILWGMAPK